MLFEILKSENELVLKGDNRGVLCDSSPPGRDSVWLHSGFHAAINVVTQQHSLRLTL